MILYIYHILYINLIFFIILSQLQFIISFRIVNSTLGLNSLIKSIRHRHNAVEIDDDFIRVNDDGKILITSPLYYLNGDPHLGHAYTVVLSDVLKRYYNLNGHRVYTLVGTDEHGTKIESTSKALGINVYDHIINVRRRFIDMFKAYNIDNDINVHTSEHKYKEFVLGIFNRLLSTGHIYKGIHKGFFSPKEDLYYPESQLINGKSPNGFDVIPIAEPAYFFKLSTWRDKLIDFYTKNDVILPNNKKNELLNILNDDLFDVAITRSNCKLGIKVEENQYIYVWFDALLCYLYHMINMNSSPETTTREPLSTTSLYGVPPEVTTYVPLAVEASSNYLPVNGNATPGDRGEGSDGSSIMGMMEDGAKDVLDVTSSGLPAADLREAEGQLNKEAVCRTTSGGDGSNVTSDGTPNGKEISIELYSDMDIPSMTYNVIGKDILNFHGLLWPSLLMSLGIEPRIRLIVHGWILNSDGNKMSKSFGNIIPALPLDYTSDVYRFTLMSLGYFANDFMYTNDMIKNIHNLIINNYANTCYRITGILDIHGILMLEPPNYIDEMINEFNGKIDLLDSIVNNCRIDRYIKILNEMSMELNKFLTENRIWELDADDKFNGLLWTATMAIFYISIVASPIMPRLCESIITTINPIIKGEVIKYNGIKFDMLKEYKYIFKPIHQKTMT